MKKSSNVSLYCIAVLIFQLAFISICTADEASRKAGKTPVDFPAVGTDASVNEYVLAPSYQFIDQAFFNGPKRAMMVFYGATVVHTGRKASHLRSLGGRKAFIPNSLIIPLKHGATAKFGDVVLTWWQSGSGMKRAYVINAEDPQRPIVRYIDIKLDNPAKRKGVPIGQLEEQLKPNSFVRLTQPWQPGTMVATAVAGKFKKIQIIRIVGNKLLGLGFGGKLAVFDKEKCYPIPIIPDVKQNDTVMFSHIGVFRKAKVQWVDTTIGRVFLQFSFGSKIKYVAAPFGDVAQMSAF